VWPTIEVCPCNSLKLDTALYKQELVHFVRDEDLSRQGSFSLVSRQFKDQRQLQDRVAGHLVGDSQCYSRMRKRLSEQKDGHRREATVIETDARTCHPTYVS
jgi:hypothetical protein